VEQTRTEAHLISEHFTRPGYPAALITAFRDTNSLEINITKNYELANRVTRSGFGRLWAVGTWRADGVAPLEEAAILVVGDRAGDATLKDFLIAMCREPRFALNGFVFKTSQCRTEIVDAQGKSEAADGADAAVDLDALARFYKRLRSGPNPDSSRFVFSHTVAPASLMLRMMGKEHYYDNPCKLPAHLGDR
jgi:hypothetical protein